MNKTIIGVSLFSFSVLFSATTFAQTTPDYAKLIEQAHQKYKSNNDGKVADYIPALATYSPKNFAITIATVDGKIYQVGDVNKPFPMESLSKVFTMALAMEQHGPQVVLDKLGANATGMPFNSGLAVELTKGAPENPLVNAGAMSTVSLIEAKDKFPGEISGGMQKRVAIARALATDPKVLLCDEATSALDSINKEKIQDLLLDIKKTRNSTMVLVTHSIEEAVFLGEEIVVMKKGKIHRIISNRYFGDKDIRCKKEYIEVCSKVREELYD